MKSVAPWDAVSSLYKLSKSIYKLVENTQRFKEALDTIKDGGLGVKTCDKLKEEQKALQATAK